MHIEEELNDRMIALGYAKRTQRTTFVNEAVEQRLEREEERRRKRTGINLKNGKGRSCRLLLPYLKEVNRDVTNRS